MILKVRSVNLFAAVALQVLGAMAACASESRVIHLVNMPEKPVDSAIVHRNSVCIAQIDDARGVNIVGELQDAFGLHTGTIKAADDVRDWVMTGVKSRLISQGYSLMSDSGQSSGCMTVYGKILRVYTTFHNSFIAEVDIDISVSMKNRVVLHKKLNGFSTTSKKRSPTLGYSYEKIIGEALDDFLGKFSDEINAVDVNAADTLCCPADDTGATFSGNNHSSNNLPGVSSSGRSDVPLNIPCPKTGHAYRIISGERDISEIQSVLSFFRAKIQRLYKDRYEVNPELKGRVCTYLIVEKTGVVSDAGFLENTLDDELINEEILKTIKKVTFVKRKFDKKPTIISCSISFDPKSTSATKVMIGLVALGALVTALIINIANSQNTPGS